MRRHRYHRHRCYHDHSGEDGALGCALMLGLGLVCLPIAGLFMMCSKDEGTKAIGGIVFVVGAIIWLFALLGA